MDGVGTIGGGAPYIPTTEKCYYTHPGKRNR